MPPISQRVSSLVAYGYDDFPLGEGDLDLRGDNSPPPTTIDAVLRRLAVTADDTASYGHVPGEPLLRQALAEIFAASPDHVIVTAGGSEALYLALTCVAKPGDSISLPRPAFPGFDQLARLAGLRPAYYQVPGELPDRTAGAPVRVVCTPHNPTGILTSRAELDPDDATWTIWDVSHMPLSGTDIEEFRIGLTDCEILVFSLSKLLRLPGARVGCLLSGSRDLVAAAIAAKTHLSMSTSRLSQHLAAQVLTDAACRRQLATRHTELAVLRRLLHDAVRASGRLVSMPAAAGTHLMVHATNGDDPWRILKDAGVVGVPGVVFNSPVRGVRLCTAQPADVIETAAKVVRTL